VSAARCWRRLTPRPRTSTSISCGKPRRQDEFGFRELALDYFGGRPQHPAGALLIRLHSSPVHFHRKAVGVIARSTETLKAALAA